MIHEFPELPYEYDSLEPFIDEKTMKIHHDKHHKTYYEKFLDLIKTAKKLEKKPIEEILSNPDIIPEGIRQTVLNQGGGYYNHSIFWLILGKDSSFDPKSEIGSAIIKKFSSFESFKEKFEEASKNLFGSGWVWLVIDEKNNLEILQTKNQDCPLTLRKIPLFCNDLWEHAYYLKYQNKRADYIEAFWNVINWNQVNKNFIAVKI